MQHFANGLAVDEHVERDLCDRLADRVRDGDQQSPAVDAGDFVTTLADHEAAAVVLFLEAVFHAVEQARDFVLLDRVEQLAADPAVAALVAGLALGFGGDPGVGEVIALGQLRGDELVEDLGGFGEAHRMGGFRSGAERVAAAAVSEGHDVAFAARFDSGVIDVASIGHSRVHPPGCFLDRARCAR
jgi:hypothetical protein